MEKEGRNEEREEEEGGARSKWEESRGRGKDTRYGQEGEKGV